MATVVAVKGGGALRGGHIEGQLVNGLPEAGKMFWMLGEPINEGTAGRMFNTSEVKEVRELEEGTYEFDTVSGSTYKLTV